MTYDIAQICFALERSAEDLQRRADQLMAARDYGAEIPDEDAKRVREALEILRGLPGSAAPKPRQGHRVHRLKTWPVFFDEIVSGAKTFDIRRDDREFCSGDVLLLEEWDPEAALYTGRKTARLVSHLARGELVPGVATGFVVMALAPGEVPL